MPGWPFNTGSGAGPTPLHPPLLGLVQWTKSDVGLTVSPATRVAGWADQSGHAQDWEQQGNNPSNAPYILGDDIDGIPLITFGVAGDANKGFQTVGTFKDRFGADMTGSSPRTIYVVTKPKFDGAFARMGGELWMANSWETDFFFDPTGIIGPVNGAYAFSGITGSGIGPATSNQFTPQNGGAGGPYDNVPRLLSWSSSARPQLTFAIDGGAPTVLAPTTMIGAAAGASIAFLGASFPAYLGGVTEVLVWDHVLDAGETATALAYIGSRYPSIALP